MGSLGMGWLGMGFRSLSRRRKLLAAGVAVVAVAGAVTAGAVALAAGGAASPATGYPAQDRPGPVLLVPGYGGQTGSLRVLAARIRATGRRAVVVGLPGSGTGSLITDAGALNTAVGRALRGGAPSVDVVGYSAGGVVALLWARDDGGSHKARRVVTLGSPFHGTRLASAAEGFVPGACPAACRQLVPGSALLAQLDRAAVPGRPRWLSLWTTGDQVVMPADSARLAGAINVPVQAVCRGHQVTHTGLPTDPVVISLVLQAIGRGPIAPASPAGCHS
jgi:triacylglycerol esterase/lipase EstA (alpha/beta hydrolase family)